MEMRYFWLLNQEAQKMFQFLYQPGAENLADYPTRHIQAQATNTLGLTTYTKTILHVSSLVPPSPVHGEGVLKSSGTHMTKRSHYLGFPIPGH